MHFAYYVMRVAISRPCPGVHFRPFQAAPLRTPAAICQDTGSPGCRSRRPGAALMSLFLFAKVYYIFLICKKNSRNFQEIFDFVDIQLVTKRDFSRFSGVKRFNSIILYIRYPAGVAESVPGITPDNIKPWRIPDKARTILNRFISASRTPGG